MTTATRQLLKDVRYDRTTHDYAMYLDGEIVGYAATKDEAETELSKLVVNILEHERPTPSYDPDFDEQARGENSLYPDLDDLTANADDYEDFFAEQFATDAEMSARDAALVVQDETPVAGAVAVALGPCDLCDTLTPALCEYGDGQLCKAHYEAALEMEQSECPIPFWPPMAEISFCLVCGQPATTEWAGDDPYCQVHLDELLALDTSDTPHTYAVVGTIAWGEARIKTSAEIAAHSKLEAARLVLASVALPWHARWADVYVVTR